MNKDDALFEISWEVCNKVGGIYTVITSKIKSVLKYIDINNYFVMGPFYEGSYSDFEEKEIPLKFKDKFEELEKIGIKVHYGIWKDKSYPVQVLLIEHLEYSSHINDIKGKLWELYNIDSLNSSWYDFDEAILWSWCCGIVVEKLSELFVIKGDGEEVLNDIYIHSHEWMAGGAILYLKSLDSDLLKYPFNTVFTTHATMLGRSLSGNGSDVYDFVKLANESVADVKAIELNVHTKHQTEKALSKFSDAFSTVSNITAEEANSFYGKMPDVLLYNGFDNSDMNFLDDLSVLYDNSRRQVVDFLKSHFSKYYDIDVDNSKIFYTSGRNEFRSKGIDLYTKALGELNDRLKKDENSSDIFNLFLIPVGDFKRIDDLSNIGSNSGKLWDFAPLSTHEVPMDNDIIKAFVDNGLLNKKEDRVKVLLVPIYLNNDDGVLSMNYYDVVSGLDLGVFLSYYEPWGYTPLESIAFGVPTITTDYAGFGRAVLRDFKDEHVGVEVVLRDGVEFDNCASGVCDYFHDFWSRSSDELVVEKNGALKFSGKFSWDKFVDNYMEVYQIARSKNR